MIHAQVYLVADYYQIPGLMNLALIKFRRIREVYTNNYIEVVKFVYNFESASVTKPLRSTLSSLLAEDGKDLLHSSEFLDEIVLVPKFLKDVLPRLCTTPERPTNTASTAARNQKRARYA